MESSTILIKQREYYENLYHDRCNDAIKMASETENILGTPNMPILDEEDKTQLDKSVTIDERTKAVKELPSNKSPVSDGHPSEFL